MTRELMLDGAVLGLAVLAMVVGLSLREPVDYGLTEEAAPLTFADRPEAPRPAPAPADRPADQLVSYAPMSSVTVPFAQPL